VSRETLIGFLSGAVALSYVIAGVFFLRFWCKTRDSLFLTFALAFWLFAVNQTLVAALSSSDERTGYAYMLRVLGFGLILLGILRKNLTASRTPGVP
jgi:uncharacterized protein DUF5985